MSIRLEFDRGTIVLPGLSEREAAGLPGVLWDSRVRIHRAPGYCYASLRAALAHRTGALHDRVLADAPGPAQAWTAPELRPYQAAALTSWELSHARGLVVLPTGAGKTVLALAAIARRECRVLCLVPTRILLEQWRSAFTRVYRGPIGQYGDGVRALEAVTLATFASAYHHMETLGRHFDLLVVDEVHHFGTGASDEALELCAAPARLGLTGTLPESAQTRSRLEELIGPLVYLQRVSDLVGEHLAPLRVVVLPLDLSPGERATYAQDVASYSPVVRQFFRYAPGASWGEFQRAAARTEQGRLALAAWRRSRRLVAFTQAKQVALTRLLADHRATNRATNRATHRATHGATHGGQRLIVFTGDNDTAYRIARDHLLMPITCDIGRAERRDVLERFRTGELRVLVSAQVLNEGLDVPDADTAILVGGRLGTREYLQRVGRLLRPGPGKQALVYELVTRGTHEVRDSQRGREALAS